MDHAVLVDIDVNIGLEIIKALDAENIELKVAIWATFPEYYSPRLIFAANWLDQFDPLARYEKFGEILHGKFSNYSLLTILLLKMSDPFIKELRASLAPLKDIKGMRLDSQSFGGRYMEDGYVYRVQ